MFFLVITKTYHGPCISVKRCPFLHEAFEKAKLILFVLMRKVLCLVIDLMDLQRSDGNISKVYVLRINLEITFWEVAI
jgi:hypothetical protein